MTTSEAAETLGHITFRRKVEATNHALAVSGAVEPAAGIQTALCDILRERGAPPSVVEKVGEVAKQYAVGARPTAAKPRSHQKRRTT